MKMEVERKNTDGLRNELMDAPNLQAFLSANEANFSSESASMLLNEMLERKGISKASLAKQSGMSEIYLHQIFAGRRNPSRSRVLCLCFGLNASLEEAQELLRNCGYAELYPQGPARCDHHLRAAARHGPFRRQRPAVLRGRGNAVLTLIR